MNPEDLIDLEQWQRQAQRLADLDLWGFFLAWGLRALAGVLILVAAWLFAGWARRSLERALRKTPRMDPTLIPLFARILRYAILAMAVVIVLAQFGVQTTGLIALLGAAGLAIGLALQGTLSNVASGVMLIILRPMRVGDVVRSGNLEGSVEEIGLFNSVLRGYDYRLFVIPNRTLFESPIENLTRLNVRRVTLTFYVAANAPAARAVEIIRQTANNHPLSLKEPAPFVAHHGLEPSGQKILAYIWMRPDNFGAVMTDVASQAIDALNAEGIPMAETPFRRKNAP